LTGERLHEDQPGHPQGCQAQNDAGGSLAEAGMAEMLAKFRAGGGAIEVKV
jgi:hypothetical protein